MVSAIAHDHDQGAKNPGQAGVFLIADSGLELRPMFHDRNVAHAATVSATCL
jgi:hypothetical protein